MQVYMPTTVYENDELEKLYVTIEGILEEDGIGDTNDIIMGDWIRIQMLIGFCERKGLIVNNTWFKKPKRKLYTWKAPGDWIRHQLDYILVKHRFRNCVKDVQTLPGGR